jgi:hypothetical protein
MFLTLAIIDNDETKDSTVWAFDTSSSVEVYMRGGVRAEGYR